MGTNYFHKNQGDFSTGITLINFGMSDQQIIEAIRAGSEEQLKDLYIRYKEEFANWLVKSYQCSKEDALEIFQLSVVLLYDNIILGKLSVLSSSLKSYLFAIGKNKAKELQRRQAKFGFELDEQLINQLKEEEPETVDNQEDLSLMNKALKALGETCQELLEMFYYQDLSMLQISELKGYKNTGTTKNMKYKCLKRLQVIFAEQTTKHR